ncbi:MAG TPA: FxSxx-COOH system tetratricopeptide repeat protein [Ktedonobacteraceae bacterium]|nr:FxSxx-COOH system tetratricopeptide repeat protein [Ktedonobacteraceae bacterium]
MSHRKDQLRHERIQRNWRQQDLADQLGTTVVTVQRWERGSHQPSAYFRLKLCTLFGKSAEELGLVAVDPSSPIITETVSETRPIPSSPPETPAALWTVPYRRNPHFTGRDELLDQLARQLSPEKQADVTTTRRAILSQPQAIKGLGGIGKTQVALEYAYRSRQQDRYTHTFWINAANEEAIITSFLQLADLLPAFSARGETNQQQVITAIKSWLEQCPQPWLLIFDNADELALIEPYLPQQGQGSILLTTRAHAVAALASAIEVDQMSLLEGTQLLLHRSQHLNASDEMRNEATNIVIALDGFPLALDQAGAYIEETGCRFGDYLRLYEQHRARLLARRGKQATHYPDSVATTWDLSFREVERTHPAAAELLRLCASFSPDHIPEELITDAAAHWPPLLQQAVVDPLSFNELLEALLAFSLVKRLAEEHLVSIHRLVQAVQLDRMEPEEQRIWAQRVVRAVNALFPADPKNEITTWPQCLRYLEQVQACDRLIQEHGLQLPEAAELLNRAGVYLREHASYGIAEPLFQRALLLSEEQWGPEHSQVASPLHNLGILYWRQGKFELAEFCYQRALHIWEQALGPEHPQLASLLHNLGILYAEQGKFELAESCYQRALHIWEQTLGPEHPQLASLLNNLGVLYKGQGQYALAEPLYQRALRIREQTLGPEHPQLAEPLNNLGGLYAEQGKYELAEPLLQRALRIGEQALGPHHPQLAATLNNLGIISTEQGQFELAEARYQRALSLREQVLGLHHPSLAVPLNGLGHIYSRQGKYALAEPLYQRALHIGEQALGLHHHQLAESLDGLANLRREQGQYEQAEALYQRALSLRQQSLGLHHPHVAETLHELARCYQQQQQTTKALSLYQQALDIREQALGLHHPKTIATRAALTHLCQEMGQTEGPSDPHRRASQTEETRSLPSTG